MSLIKVDPKKAAALKTKEDGRQGFQFLAETDWYVIRKQETGIDVPKDVLLARAEARAKINLAKE